MPERHGYSVQFSTINPNLLIVAASQRYGRRGGGTLFLLKLLSDNEIICLRRYEWTDALFDAVSLFRNAFRCHGYRENQNKKINFHSEGLV